MSRRFEAAGLFGLLAGAALLFSRTLDAGPNYDEGVYLASADALARGGQLGEDVFASQPPGFYLLLRLATALPGGTVEATRALFLVVALVGVAAAWCARPDARRPPRAGSPLVLSLLAAPSFAVESTRIAADMPSIALALVALALLAEALERQSVPLAGRCRADALGSGLGEALRDRRGGAGRGDDPGRQTFAAVARGDRRRARDGPARCSLRCTRGDLGALYDDVVSFHTSARDAGGGPEHRAGRALLRALDRPGPGSSRRER